MKTAINASTSRIGWIDYAKGLCIIMVVMMYATEWVSDSLQREGWLHSVVEFARPFHMPDFFLVSGLLLSHTIGRDWITYFDRKVVHFAYFYILWLTIAYVVMGRSMSPNGDWQAVLVSYFHSYVRPFAWLWFIYLLPFFFLATRLTARWHVGIVWSVAAVLHVAQLNTDIKVLDKFAQYFLFFYTGYAFAPLIFKFADAVKARPWAAFAGLLMWGVAEAYLVSAQYSTLPLLSLVLAFTGSAAVIAVAALMAQTRWFSGIGYCGANSIVIYLAFFIPVMAARSILVRFGFTDAGTVALVATVAGVAGALALHWAVRRTPMRILFERPARLRLHRSPAMAGA